MLGLEIGEWVKFLPQVQAGQTIDRTYFYLPPLTASLAILLWSAGWRGWQAVVVRGVAMIIATLALPAIPDILNRSNPGEMGERIRVGCVLLIGILALYFQFRRRTGFGRKLPYALIILGLVGAIMPTYSYFSFRPIIATYLRFTPGVGYGLWLTLGGHCLLILAGLLLLRQQKEQQTAAALDTMTA